MKINGKLIDARIPGCPHCGSVLMEYASREEWDRQARKFADKEGVPLYPEWLDSLRKKPCRRLDNWDWRADLKTWLEARQ